MKSVAVVALALLDGVAAFQAPAARSPTKVSKVSMFKEGDIGVTPPLGVWDPLGLISKRDMRRYEIMEIKHGRAAMLGFIHTVLIEAGARWPGYISPSSGAPPPRARLSRCWGCLRVSRWSGWRGRAPHSSRSIRCRRKRTGSDSSPCMAREK